MVRARLRELCPVISVIFSHGSGLAAGNVLKQGTHLCIILYTSPAKVGHHTFSLSKALVFDIPMCVSCAILSILFLSSLGMNSLSLLNMIPPLKFNSSLIALNGLNRGSSCDIPDFSAAFSAYTSRSFSEATTTCENTTALGKAWANTKLTHSSVVSLKELLLLVGRGCLDRTTAGFSIHFMYLNPKWKGCEQRLTPVHEVTVVHSHQKYPTVVCDLFQYRNSVQ